MRSPIRYRCNIPFYNDKSISDFRQDPYERYDPLVIRQSMIHLSDHLWGSYPMQEILDYVLCNTSDCNNANILEIGCGVGRCIGALASRFTDAECWGIDYSYQMLRQAKRVWVEGENVVLMAHNYGFSEEVKIEGKSLTNINFGLAQCEDLPFADESQDLVFSSFLLDRLSDPIQGLKEMKRVLRPKGKIIIISPMNFNKKLHWERFFPDNKLKEVLTSLEFNILNWQEDILVEEPLDRRRNEITWKCIGLVLQ